jgi:hypothetical protein
MLKPFLYYVLYFPLRAYGKHILTFFSFRSIKICAPGSFAETDDKPGSQGMCPAADNWKKHPVSCETQVTFCHAMLLSKILTKIINGIVREYSAANISNSFGVLSINSILQLINNGNKYFSF